MRLYLFSTPDGMPVIGGLVGPKIAEREAIEQMLRGFRHLVFEGQFILRDKGFSGRTSKGSPPGNWARICYARIRKDEKPRYGQFGRTRQWIESVFDTLKGQPGLKRHGVPRLAGHMAKIGAKLLAMTNGIWHNCKSMPRVNAL